MRVESPAQSALFELHEPAWPVREPRRPAEAQPSPTGEVPWVALPPCTLWSLGMPVVALHLASSSWTDSINAEDSAIFVRNTGGILPPMLSGAIFGPRDVFSP